MTAAIHIQAPMGAAYGDAARGMMSILQRIAAIRPPAGVDLAAGINAWRRVPIAWLAVAALASCTQPVSPPDTPVARLNADLAAMRAFPSPKVTARCAAALRELSSARQAIADQQQTAKPVDPVSLDVLQSDQEEAETSCHPDAVRLCQVPVDQAATKACARLEP
jgi:hypothetical protein